MKFFIALSTAITMLSASTNDIPDDAFVRGQEKEYANLARTVVLDPRTPFTQDKTITIRGLLVWDGRVLIPIIKNKY